MYPDDILRLIFIKATEGMEWFNELPSMLKNIYEIRQFRRFLNRDKLFWREIYKRMGLNLIESEKYFDDYNSMKWLYHINLEDTKGDVWDGIFFKKQNRQMRVIYPHKIKINEHHFSICGNYLAIMKDNIILIYYKHMNEESIIHCLTGNCIMNVEAIYIKETYLGLILGISDCQDQWGSYLLGEPHSREITRLPLLDNIKPCDIFKNGYYDEFNDYYRFDNSPISKKEMKLYYEENDSIFVDPCNSSIVIKLDSNREIHYYDTNTGGRLKNEHNETYQYIYNKNRTKFAIFKMKRIMI